MTLLINADHAGEKPRVGERGRDEDFREEGWETRARKNSQNTFLFCEREYKYINYFQFHA